ncbi:hypothetical protein ACIQNG_13845 [Streptomyces sp. NPDC091377]|uniref:hypothetical protein n=1 Tax=Streptomyces sp. NPDC091377 TaxID=3365995 RepID=UPI0037FB18DA
MTKKCSAECPGQPCTVNGDGNVIGDKAVQYNCFAHGPLRPGAQRVMVVVLAGLIAVLLSGHDASDPPRSTPPLLTVPVPSASPSTTSSATPTPTPRATPHPAPNASSPPREPRPTASPTSRAPRPTESSRPPERPAPKPSPTRACPLRQQYRVNNKGQIWDSGGNRIGDVASGTLFFRRESASYPPPVDDRYYGTVDEVISGSATGYVLRKKLDYVGTVEICD